jgi:hypothetical protein
MTSSCHATSASNRPLYVVPPSICRQYPGVEPSDRPCDPTAPASTSAGEVQASWPSPHVASLARKSGMCCIKIGRWYPLHPAIVFLVACDEMNSHVSSCRRGGEYGPITCVLYVTKEIFLWHNSRLAGPNACSKAFNRAEDTLCMFPIS